MAGSALIVGVPGQIGRVVCRDLLAGGWRVTAAQRHGEGFPEALTRGGVTTVVLDREAPGALARVVGAGVDALIDTVALRRGRTRVSSWICRRTWEHSS